MQNDRGIKEIREVLNRNKGMMEDAARKGIPAWANATSLMETADKCFEMGELLTRATQTIDMPMGGDECERIKLG